MKKVLFHICCGPCATASIKKLKEEGFEVVGFYYNPNIHPEEEYEKRLSEAKKLAEQVDFELIISEYDSKEYFGVVNGLEENQSKRCPKCWELRLKATAEKALGLGIGLFGTTLRISPYQNQEELLKLGKKIAEEKNLSFYEEDLVSCFRESISLSKEKAMYRQKYCGCIFSKQ